MRPSLFCAIPLCLFLLILGQPTAEAELDDGNVLLFELAGITQPEVSVEAGEENSMASAQKRTMRNALVRLGRSPRSSATMRNALVRFGKRSAAQAGGFDEDQQMSSKRNSAPQPFVRFGRSPAIRQQQSGEWASEHANPSWLPGFAFL